MARNPARGRRLGDSLAVSDSSPPALPKSMLDYLDLLAKERHLSALTVSSYRRELRELVRLASQQGLGQDFALIEDRHARHWIAKMHSQGLQPRSLAHRLSAWRSFLTHLASRGEVPGNPLVSVRAPKSPKRLPKALSAELAIRLVAPDVATSQQKSPQTVRDEAIYELLYSSGLRVSELIDIDVTARHSRGYIDSNAGEVEVTGKGNKRRRVPVGAPALAALQCWLQVRDQIAKADEPALFVSSRGVRLSARTLQARLKAHGVARDIPANVHPHVLRHSFASHVLQSSGDLRAVQEMLGHASIASTQVYTSLDFQRLAAVYDEAHPRAKKKTPAKT